MKTKSKAGFTLVELLMATAVIGLLLTIGLASYVDYNRKRRVRESALDLLNNLRFAQEKALSGEKPSSGSCSVLDGWKLEFISNEEYCVQAVCSGVGVGDTRSYQFEEGVSKTSGSNAFLFRVLALGVNFSGSGEIQLSGFGRVEKIVVEEAGNIHREE
jgi:prepilin-type N-terminal cleavage/methylation domain-containing protein